MAAEKERSSKSARKKPRERAASLTVKRLAKIKTPGRYRDGATRGLYLDWRSKTSASWLYRFEVAGRERWLGLGSLLDVSLDEAREKAMAARRGLRSDAGRIDPIDARRAARAAETAKQAEAASAASAPLPESTFEKVADRVYNAKRAEWKNDKHSAQFLSTLQQYASPYIGAMDVAAIETADVLRCLEPIWRTKTETAKRVRGRIANVLDAAKGWGLRSGDNPAAWLFIRQNLPSAAKIAKVRHHAALPYENIPTFMKALTTRPGIAAKALEFTILSAARTGETIGAVWSEIDWDARLWKIPAARMKMDREHQVPLSQRAFDILKALYKVREKNNPHIFIGPQKGSGLSNAAMMATIKRMIDADPAMAKLLSLPNGKHVSVHGFRSAFRDWGGEETSHPRDALEFALAHDVRSGVEGSYARRTLLLKRTALMKDWANYCAGELPLAKRENVADEDVAA